MRELRHWTASIAAINIMMEYTYEGRTAAGNEGRWMGGRGKLVAIVVRWQGTRVRNQRHLENNLTFGDLDNYYLQLIARTSLNSKYTTIGDML